MKTFTLILLFLACASANAQIIHVPADYPTVQQGINAATPGDTVLVADGIYYEQISFLGKPITVASNYIIDADASHISNTILDGAQLHVGNASVVLFTSGEDTTSIINGFTIRHGKGTLNGTYLIGGGIFINNSSATIINNRITQNIINGHSTCVAGGAAISTPYASTDNWIVILNNTIDSNQCSSNYYDAAGAAILSCYNTRMENNVITHNASINSSGRSFATIFIESLSIPPDNKLIAVNNVIQYNSAISNSNEVRGAAMWCAQLDATIIGNNISYNEISTTHTAFGGAAVHLKLPVSTVMESNLFNYNISSSYGGAVYILEDQSCLLTSIENNDFTGNEAVRGGGALYACFSNLRLKNNRFNLNNASIAGGALYLFENNGDGISIMENNTFISNQAGKGGAVHSANSNLLFTNNVFHLNQAGGNYGGALYMQKTGTPGTHARLINNSFSENSALTAGGAIFSFACNPEILNTVFWQNTAPVGAEIDIAFGTGSIAYSNIDLNQIQGIFELHEGNIFEDPQFIQDELLMPDAASPCIDAGADHYCFPTNAGVDTCYAPLYDIMAHFRPLDKGYDMGAYEVLVSSIKEKLPTLELSLYPNPFTDKINCKYYLDKVSVVSITVYDLIGRAKTGRNMKQGVGEHNITLGLEMLSSGVYLVKISTEDRTIVKKIIKR